MVIQWLEAADKLQGFYVVSAILHEMACIFYHKHNMTIDINNYILDHNRPVHANMS